MDSGSQLSPARISMLLPGASEPESATTSAEIGGRTAISIVSENLTVSASQVTVHSALPGSLPATIGIETDAEPPLAMVDFVLVHRGRKRTAAGDLEFGGDVLAHLVEHRHIHQAFVAGREEARQRRLHDQRTLHLDHALRAAQSRGVAGHRHETQFAGELGHIQLDLRHAAGHRHLRCPQRDRFEAVGLDRIQALGQALRRSVGIPIAVTGGMGFLVSTDSSNTSISSE